MKKQNRKKVKNGEKSGKLKEEEIQNGEDKYLRNKGKWRTRKGLSTDNTRGYRDQYSTNGSKIKNTLPEKKH